MEVLEALDALGAAEALQGLVLHGPGEFLFSRDSMSSTIFPTQVESEDMNDLWSQYIDKVMDVALVDFQLPSDEFATNTTKSSAATIFSGTIPAITPEEIVLNNDTINSCTTLDLEFSNGDYHSTSRVDCGVGGIEEGEEEEDDYDYNDDGCGLFNQKEKCSLSDDSGDIHDGSEETTMVSIHYDDDQLAAHPPYRDFARPSVTPTNSHVCEMGSNLTSRSARAISDFTTRPNISYNRGPMYNDAVGCGPDATVSAHDGAQDQNQEQLTVNITSEASSLYAQAISYEQQGMLHKARLLFLQAAGRNHLDAQFKCAVYYSKGMGGIAKNKRFAFRWLLPAAERQHHNAMVMLAGFYLKGKGGVERDPARAFELICTPAKAGHSRAALKLALMYEEGIMGLPPNYEKAREWLEVAVQRRQGAAYPKLAEYYEHGLGGADVDQVKAQALYQEDAAIKSKYKQQQSQQQQQQQLQLQQSQQRPLQQQHHQLQSFQLQQQLQQQCQEYRLKQRQKHQQQEQKKSKGQRSSNLSSGCNCNSSSNSSSSTNATSRQQNVSSRIRSAGRDEDCCIT